MDVHRDFCEVAIAEGGRVRSAGRIRTRVGSLELFAQSLVAGDIVALEATSGTDKIVSVLQTHGVRVVVANTRKLKSISEAKAKTDRLDARTLARLLMSGLLDQVWTPDERTRTLRRLTNRRERLVRARTRAKGGERRVAEEQKEEGEERGERETKEVKSTPTTEQKDANKTHNRKCASGKKVGTVHSLNVPTR